MKSLITLIAALVFSLLSSFAFSAEKPSPLKFVEVESIIDHYIEATTNGHTAYLNDLFTSDFKFTTPSNLNSKPVNKQAMVSYLKSLEAIKMTCDTDYSIVEKNKDSSIIKLTANYGDFERIDYITICHSDLGWKISNVMVTYPEK